MKPASIPGSVTAPKGFLASGVFCDIKRLGTGKGSDKGPKLDLGLIVSETPAVVAGMFTTNQVCAAPVKWCIDRVRRGKARAIVANSGNANACTGVQGLKDARTMAEAAGQALQLPADSVLVASTGRIGVPLPMSNVKRGIRSAAVGLGSSAKHAAAVAEAIMTSDTRMKQVAVEFKVDDHTVRLGGICKGAGMIQPGMSADGRRPAAAPTTAGLHATMLCFLTTDAAIERKALRSALQEAVAASFNRITVDGDMSTNDTVLLLANGCAGNPLITASGRRPGNLGAKRATDRKAYAAFSEALQHVCLELAKLIVRDGEGVSRFVTVRVEGARTPADADAAARAVANSSLVKASWCGGDPNWGRIMDAIGYSSAKVVESKVDIAYVQGAGRPVYSLRRGQPTSVSFAQLCRCVAGAEFELLIDLNLGRHHAVMYASDLTEAYVEFNKGNVSDPKSLGG